MVGFFSLQYIAMISCWHPWDSFIVGDPNFCKIIFFSKADPPLQWQRVPPLQLRGRTVRRRRGWRAPATPPSRTSPAPTSSRCLPPILHRSCTARPRTPSQRLQHCCGSSKVIEYEKLKNSPSNRLSEILVCPLVAAAAPKRYNFAFILCFCGPTLIDILLPALCMCSYL